MRKFLECGDIKHGFARVRCPKCRDELFVPFSCRVRCFCPSCLPGRSFSEGRPPEAGAGEGWLCLPAEASACACPHADRSAQAGRAAVRTVMTVYRAASGRPEAAPGTVGAIPTFGQLIHWHPHIHALVSEHQRTIQQVELVPKPFKVIEYTAYSIWCHEQLGYL